MVIQDFKVIQGRVFWGQWKGDKEINNTIHRVRKKTAPLNMSK